jgi:hypothetical protein
MFRCTFFQYLGPLGKCVLPDDMAPHDLLPHDHKMLTMPVSPRPHGQHSAYAEADALRHLSLVPYCWQNLEMCIPPWRTEAAPVEVEREQWCITRFVIGSFGGRGSARVLGPCPLDNVPSPYHAETGADYESEEDKACFRRSHLRPGLLRDLR